MPDPFRHAGTRDGAQRRAPTAHDAALCAEILADAHRRDIGRRLARGDLAFEEAIAELRKLRR